MKTRKTSREANQKALNITPRTQSANQNMHTQRGDGLGTSHLDYLCVNVSSVYFCCLEMGLCNVSVMTKLALIVCADVNVTVGASPMFLVSIVSVEIASISKPVLVPIRSI